MKWEESIAPMIGPQLVYCWSLIAHEIKTGDEDQFTPHPNHTGMVQCCMVLQQVNWQAIKWEMVKAKMEQRFQGKSAANRRVEYSIHMPKGYYNIVWWTT